MWGNIAHFLLELDFYKHSTVNLLINQTLELEKLSLDFFCTVLFLSIKTAQVKPLMCYCSALCNFNLDAFWIIRLYYASAWRPATRPSGTPYVNWSSFKVYQSECTFTIKYKCLLLCCLWIPTAVKQNAQRCLFYLRRRHSLQRGHKGCPKHSLCLHL